MRVISRLFCLALCAGCAAAASATPIDFRAHVLDPPAPSFPTQPITTLIFQLSFVTCQPGELPNGMTAQGCFAGVNRTGLDWTNLQFGFQNTAALNSQPASCAPASSNNIFGTTSCGLDQGGQGYTLDFSGGVLKDGELFFVTEDGVDPSLFPTVDASVLSVAVVSPEPGSLVLLSTGVGVLAAFRRKLRT